MNLAPIILFVYNRPWHTEQTLCALTENELAKHSILYIYADGAKDDVSEDDLKKINETRNVIRKKKWCREVHIIESKKNKGLADSVIDGTTEIVNKYGTIITLEDDVVVSKHFLNFMNDALDKYAQNEEVLMIAGYLFPASTIKRQQSSFFLPLTTTQAWGTWKRAWNKFDILATGYQELKTNNELRKKFNLDNSYDFSAMLIKQMESEKISSWAIRWWWTIFKMNGLVLYPDKSLIKNTGWDGSGTHSGSSDPFFDPDWKEDYVINSFPSKIQADKEKFTLLKEYLKQKNTPSAPSSIKKILDRLRKKLSW